MSFLRWVGSRVRRWRRSAKVAAPRRDLHPDLYVLHLEERRVLNGAPLAEFLPTGAEAHSAREGGAPSAARPAAPPSASPAEAAPVFHAGAQADDGQDDVFLLRRVATKNGAAIVEIQINDRVAYRGPWESDTLTFQGSTDGDTLRIDFSGGDPLGATRLAFDVGGPAGRDALIYLGGDAARIVHQFAAAPGTDLLAYRGQIGMASIHVTGLQLGADEVFDRLAAAERELHLSSPGETITLAGPPAFAEHRGPTPGTSEALVASVRGAAFLTTAPPSELLAIRLDAHPSGEGDADAQPATDLQMRLAGGSIEQGAWRHTEVTIDGARSQVAFLGDGPWAVGHLAVAARSVRIEQPLTVAEQADLRAAEGMTVTADAGVRLAADAVAGTIALDAGAGRLNVAGFIDASRSAAGQRGGTIYLLGEEVRLASTARIDASGADGGGTILVGGDYRGQNSDFRNARRVTVEAGAVLRADAVDRGDGGRAIVWADQITRFAGLLSARGGRTGGEGGFAEVSGKETLVFRGQVDLTAAHGAAGQLLLDPRNITIVAGAAAGTLADIDEYGDDPGDDVTITNGTLTAITNTGVAVTLQANNDIYVKADILTDNALGDGGALTLQAGRSIVVDPGVTIATDNATLAMIANDAVLPGDPRNARRAQRSAGAGAIVMGDGATLDAGSGAIFLTVSDGDGLNNAESGDLEIENLVGGYVALANRGATAGSGVRRVSDDALITAATLTIEVHAAGGEIGTAAHPLRVQTSSIAAAGQSGGIFLASPTQGVNVVFDEIIAGLSTADGGDIALVASGDIVVSAGISAGGAGNVLLDAGAGAILVEYFSTGIASASGHITLTSDSLDLQAQVQSGGGALVLQPSSTTRAIALNPASPGAAGIYELDASELDLLADGFASIAVGRADGAHAITVGAPGAATSFRDPLTLRTPAGGSIAVFGQLDTLAGSGGDSLTFDGPGATTTLAADIITAGGAVTFSDAVQIAEGLTVLIDTTADGNPQGADIVFENAVNGEAPLGTLETLVLNAGTAGNLEFQSAVGDAQPLNITILNSGHATFAAAVTAATVTLTDTTGTIAFAGNATLAALVTAAEDYDLELTGALNAIAADTTFLHTGSLTLGDEATDQTTFAGGLDTTAVTGTVTLAGTIATTNAPLDLGPVTLTANTVLATGAGAAAALNVGAVTGNGHRLTLDAGNAAAIVVASFTGGDLEVRASGSTTFTGAVTAGTVTLTDTENAITFAGATNIGTLTTTAQGYRVAFLAATTVAGDTTFLNAGGLTLGAAAANVITFQGGLDTTNVTGTVTLAGTIATTNTPLDLGPVTLTANTVLATGAGAAAALNVGAVTGNGHRLTLDAGNAAAITVASFTGGDLEVRASGSTTFAGAVTAGTVTLTDTTGTIAFRGNATLTTLLTAAEGYRVEFTGASNTIANAVTFLHTGGLTLGDNSADQTTFAGGLDATAVTGTVRLAGAIAATNAPMNFGPVTLTAATRLDTGGGALTVGAVSSAGRTLTLDAGAAAIAVASFAGGGNLVVENSGGTTFTGSVTAGNVTLADTTGTIAFRGNATLAALTTAAQNYAVEFTGSTNAIAAAVAFQHTGGLTLGDHASDQITFAGGMTATAPAPIVLAGTVRTTADPLALGDVSLAADTILDTNGGPLVVGAVTSNGHALALDAGAGTITVASFAGGGNVEIVDSSGATLTGTIDAGTVRLTDTVGTIAFRGDATLGTLITAARAYRVEFTGGSNAIASSTTFLNTGGLALGDEILDRLDFIGGVDATNVSGLVTVAGTVATHDAAMDLGAVTLTANATLATRLATGADLRVGAISAGPFVLGLDAGSAGTVQVASFLGTGDLVLAGSAAATFVGPVTAGHVDLIQTAGTIAFQSNIAFGSLLTHGGGYALVFGGAANAITALATFDHRGALTLGDAAGDHFVFRHGVTVNAAASGPTQTTLGGLIETENDSAISLLGPTALAADTTLRTDRLTVGGSLHGGGFQLRIEPDEATDALQIGAGALAAIDVLALAPTTVAGLVPNTFAAITIGRADGQHAISIGAADFADPLTIRTPAGGAIQVVGRLTTVAGGDAAALTLNAGAGPILLGADLVTRGGAVTLLSDVQLADGAAARVDATDGGLAPGGAGLQFAGAVNGHVPSGDGGETLSLNAGSDHPLRFERDLGAAQPLSLVVLDSSATTFAAAVRGESVLLQDTSGTIAFEGDVAISTGLATGAAPFSLSFTGAQNHIAGTTVFRHTGTLTLGDQAGDSFTFVGGLTTAGAATNPAMTFLAGEFLTHGAPIVWGRAELRSAVRFDATDGGAFSGGALRFAGLLDGAFALTLTAGDAEIVFDQAVGQSERLGDLLIASAGNVTAAAAVQATSVVQQQGAAGATTAFLGALHASGPQGIDLTAFHIALAGPVQTAGGGGARFANAGLLHIGVGANLNLDGAFAQVGAGAVQLGANLATTGDAVRLASAVTLLGPVEIETGAGPGDLQFDSPWDGLGFDLTLDAGQGAITFSQPVANLGALVVRDGGTQTYHALHVASLEIQNAGSQIALRGAVQASGNVRAFSAGDLQQAGPVTAGGDVVYETVGVVEVTAPIDAGGALRLDASGGITVAAGAPLTAGGAASLGELRTGALALGADVTAGGALALHRATTLTADVALVSGGAAGDDITLFAALDGPHALTIDAGAGGHVRFAQGGGNAVPLAALTVANSHALAFEGLALRVTGDLAATAQRNLVIQATLRAGNLINLHAGGSAIDANGAAANVVAPRLIVAAGEGVDLDTAVAEATVETAAGDIRLDEADAVVFVRLAAPAGTIVVTAGGATRLEEAIAHAVEVETALGNLVVASIQATTSIRLAAEAGEILDDGDAGTRVAGDALTLRAAEGAGRSGAGEELDAAVNTLLATVGGSGLFLGNAGPLRVERVEAMAEGADVVLTTSSGDVTVVSLRAADQTRLAAATGAIRDAGAGTIAVQSRTLALSALQGVGAAAQPLRFTAEEIDAHASSGAIYLGSFATAPVTATELHAGAGPLEFVQTGGQALVVVAAQAPAGSALLANEAGNLRVVSLVAGPTGNVHLLTTLAGDIGLGAVVAGGSAVITSAGAIADALADADIDLQAAAAALRAVGGIGAGDGLETHVPLLALENVGGGDIWIDSRAGGVLVLGTVDGLTGVAQRAGRGGAGHIVIGHNGSLTVAGALANEVGGDLRLTTSSAGALTLQAPVTATGGHGHIVLFAAGDLVLRDTGFDPDISVTGNGTFDADWRGRLDFGPGVLVASATGAVASAPPQLFAIATTQVTALGEVEVTGRVGLPGERNFTLRVDWSDGTVSEPMVLSEAGAFRATHIYAGNPNALDPAAPIPITLSLANDENITFRGAEVTTFVLGAANVRADGESLLIQIVAPVPGEGLFPSVGLLRFAEAAPTESAPAPVAAIRFQAAGWTAATTSFEAGAGAPDAGATEEAYLLVQALTPSDDEGGTIVSVEKRLPVKVLADLPGLFRLLPNDRYRLVLVRRDGGRLVVIEGLVRDGKFFDPSGAQEQVPRVRVAPAETPPGALPLEAPARETGAEAESRLPADGELRLEPAGELPPGQPPAAPAESAHPAHDAAAAGMAIGGVAGWGRAAGILRRRRDRRKACERQPPSPRVSPAARIVRRLGIGNPPAD